MNAAPSFREVLQQGSLEPPQVLTLCELIVHVVRTRQRTIAGWRNVSIGERWDGGCRLHWFWVEALAERISDQESKETFYGVKNVLRAAAEAEQMVQRLRAAGSGALSAADIAAAPAEDVARFFARTVRFAEGLLEANRSCAGEQSSSIPAVLAHAGPRPRVYLRVRMRVRSLLQAGVPRSLQCSSAQHSGCLPAEHIRPDPHPSCRSQVGGQVQDRYTGPQGAGPDAHHPAVRGRPGGLGYAHTRTGCALVSAARWET